MKQIFERRFLLLIFIVLFIIFFTTFVTGESEIGAWGINKTVGWAWDLTPINLLIFLSTSTIFLLLYSILTLLKYRTNKTLSIIQVILMVTIAIFYKPIGQYILFLLNFLSIIIFISNLIWVIKNRNNIFENKTSL